MTTWLSRGFGVLCALGGAAMWGVGLASLHPGLHVIGSEGPVWRNYDSTLAQDVRWLGIMVTAVGVVLALRGKRAASAGCLVGAAGWLGLDLCLVRFGVPGTRAAIPLAVAAAGIALGAVVLVLRASRSGSGDRRVLVVAGVVAAAALPLTALMDIWDGLHAQSSPASFAALALLMGAAVVGCAGTAAPTLEGVRRWLAAALAVVVVAGPVWVYMQEPYDEIPGDETVSGLVVAVVAVTGVAALAWDRPVNPLGWSFYPVVAVGVLVVYPAVFVVLLNAGTPSALSALVVGLVLGIPMSCGVTAR